MCIPVALLAGLNLRVLISITINHAHTRTHETAKSSKKKTTERCYRCLTKKRPSGKELDRMQNPCNPKFNVACAELAMQQTDMKTPIFYKTVKALLQH